MTWLRAWTRTGRIERRAYRWLLKMLDDPARHRAALEHWLAKDPDHRLIYDRVAGKVHAASGVAARTPSLRTSATRSSMEVPTEWWRSGKLALVGTLALATGLLSFAGGHLRLSSGPDGADPAAAASAYETGARSKTVTLADGSAVELAADTAMHFRTSERERSVNLLRGTARFSVAHDRIHPFRVRAAGGTITAVGTRFDVTIGPRVTVRLLEGAVDVRIPQTGGTQAGRGVRLYPGQQLSFTAVTPTTGLLPTERTGDQARVAFDDVPASRIAEQVNAQSEIKIVFADADQSQRRVFAELEISNAEAVAHKLSMLLGLTVDRRQPDQLILTRRQER